MVLVALLTVAGCSSGPGSANLVTPSVPPSSGPEGVGPIHEVKAHSCRLATTDFIRNTMGMRLGRVTRLRGDGIAGCRFYALQGSPLHASEHLPGPHQPVLEILTRRFGLPYEARKAMLFLAEAGKNGQHVPLGKGGGGVCFQTNFYPKDRGMDWACAATKGRTEVVVHSVDTTGTFSTATVVKSVLARV
jgi:hypothetical protein